MRRPRILFIAPSRTLTFVEHDVAILSRSFDVEVLARSELPARRRLLPAIAGRLAAARHDLVYIWFADPYDTPSILLLARLFGVPAALVVGGYEVTALPAMGYGALARRGDRIQVRLALHLAHTLLPTSQLLAREVNALGRTDGVWVIAPGIDCDFFQPDEHRAARERLAVTVGTVAEPTWRVKGLDVFAACSRLVPDAEFAILGPCEDAAVKAELCRLGGPNLTIVGRRLAPAQIRHWYQRAAVYAQLSARESFGVAVAEAMACECVPVVSAAGALPSVVGPTGIQVAAGDVQEAAAAIARGFERAPCRAARQRVEERFDAGRRSRELTDRVAALIGAGAGAPDARDARDAPQAQRAEQRRCPRRAEA